MDQTALDPECKRLSVDLAGIDYARQAEWSPRDQDWFASNPVVDHLSAAEVVDRIRDALARNRYSDYRAEWPRLVIHFIDGDVDWTEDGGDEVAGADSNDWCGPSIYRRAAVAREWRLRSEWGWRWCREGEGRSARLFLCVGLFECTRPQDEGNEE